MVPTPTLDVLRQLLRPAAVGLLLALLTVLYGQAMGVAFGVNEDAIKSRLKDSAVAVQATAYQGNSDAMKAVLEKSWAYMKRAHLHAGGMGTTALVLIVLVALLGVSSRMTLILSLGLGAGGLGYSVYWMWAGFRAPGLGGTGAAKASLQWLALPCAAAFCAATVVAMVLVGRRLLAPADRSG